MFPRGLSYLPLAAGGLVGFRLRSSASCDGERSGAVFPGFNAGGFTHDAKSGFSLFLQERCKRIFFVRHAEGYHNLAERESKYEPKNLILMKEQSGFVYLDPKLTPKGEEQCARMKASIRGNTVWGYDKPLNLDLVVVSPTTRTLQTAVLSLGSPSSTKAPPFIANELCREHISDAMCDSRRPISELKKDFPAVDFSLCTDEEDLMFMTKESDEDVEQRGRRFLMWLCGRPEQRIAVVTHSIFLKELLRQFGDNVSADDRKRIHDVWVNAEMRSIMLCAHRDFESTLTSEENSQTERTQIRREFLAKSQAARAMWKNDSTTGGGSSP